MKGVKLNRRGMAELLKSDAVRKHLRSVAEPIAIAVALNPRVARLEGAEVRLEDYETDRAVVQVVLDHVAAAGIEGKYRVLRETARSQGLDVDGEDE